MADALRDDAGAIAARFAAALADPEARAAQAGLDQDIAVQIGEVSVGLVPGVGGYGVALPAPAHASVRLVAPPEVWAEALQPLPPPGAHSVTALLRTRRFRFDGDPLAFARALMLLERLLEVLRGPPSRAKRRPVPRDPGRIRGRYHRLATPGGWTATVYAERAGEGAPLLLLHTAGADGRQFQAQLADVELGRSWALHAFDLPMHGRSMPPDGWDGGLPRLTSDAYVEWCVAFLEQVVGGPAVIAGCSMGAAMALVLAAVRPELVRGVVAIEAPYRARGRLNVALAHAAVNSSAHNPAYVRGLMSPGTPEAARRAAAWIYGQGGLGVYAGDLSFYEEFDGGEIARRIDGARCPVAFLTGGYDYSATPDDAARLAALVPGSTVDIMPDLGHFPMLEDPDRFRDHLVPALERIAARLPGTT